MKAQNLALLRWLIRRCGHWTTRFIFAAVVGCIAIVSLRVAGDAAEQWRKESPLGFLLDPGVYAMLLLPLVVRLASIDWSDLQVERPGPGIDPFLLRQPVSAKQMATTLAAFRTGTLWLVLWVVLFVFGALPWLAFWASGLITLQSVGISLWLTSIVWRPFHLGGLRIITLAAVTLSAIFLSALIPFSFEEPRLRRFFMVFAVTIPPLIAASGWKMAVRAAVAARDGLGPATAITRLWWSLVDRREHLDRSPLRKTVPHHRNFANVRKALHWYDQRSLGQPRRLLFWWMVLPLGLIFSAMGAEPVILVAGSVMVTTYLMSTTRAHYAGVSASQRPGGGLTPLLLAASPVAAVDLVEVKRAVLLRRTLVAISTATIWIAIVFTIFHGHSGWDWWHWALRLSNASSSGNPLATGLAASAAVGMLLSGWIYGRAASSQWIVLLGRDRVTIAAIAVWALPLGVAFFLFLTWFLQQRDWAVVTEAASQAARWVPWCFAAAVVLKVVGVAVGWRISVAGDPTGHRFRRRVAFQWLAAVGLLATATWALVPEVWIDYLGRSLAIDRWSSWPLLASLGGYALMLPLARVLILPAVMKMDLHRS